VDGKKSGAASDVRRKWESQRTHKGGMGLKIERTSPYEKESNEWEGKKPPLITTWDKVHQNTDPRRQRSAKQALTTNGHRCITVLGGERVLYEETGKNHKGTHAVGDRGKGAQESELLEGNINAKRQRETPRQRL